MKSNAGCGVMQGCLVLVTKDSGEMPSHALLAQCQIQICTGTRGAFRSDIDAQRRYEKSTEKELAVSMVVFYIVKTYIQYS